MGAIHRDFLDPETEADIRVTEEPFQLEDGRTSRRLKAWVFHNSLGEKICHAEVHRTAHLGELSEIDLENIYIRVLRNGPCLWS